jgi:hypothetical protein
LNTSLTTGFGLFWFSKRILLDSGINVYQQNPLKIKISPNNPFYRQTGIWERRKAKPNIKT